jgi:hypothetical protein
MKREINRVKKPKKEYKYIGLRLTIKEYNKLWEYLKKNELEFSSYMRNCMYDDGILIKQ